MTEETKEALEVIRQACASVVANLDTHQKIQAAIMAVDSELQRLSAVEKEAKRKVTRQSELVPDKK